MQQILNIGGKILLGVISAALALVMLELAARYFLEPPYTEGNGNQWACERLIGWRGKPNTTTEVNTEGYIHPVARNAAGMHDREHQPEKAPGVFRILIMGDSFIEARQVTRQEYMPSVIEQTLNAAAPDGLRFEVINAAASAWGPDQALMYFRTEGQFYQPDLVLAFWYPANDLQDVLPDHRMTFDGFNCYAPYFPVCNGQFDSEAWFSAPGLPPAFGDYCSAGQKMVNNWLNWLYHQSRLYRQLEPLVARSQPRIKYAYDFSPWMTGATDPILEYAYQVTNGIYSQLAADATANGAQLALVVIPLKQALYYELGSPYREKIEADYPRLKAADPDLPNQIMAQQMAAQNVPVFDLQPPFVEHLRAGGGVLYWHIDSHLNVPGHQLAGELVANWLIEQGLVPVESPLMQ